MNESRSSLDDEGSANGSDREADVIVACACEGPLVSAGALSKACAALDVVDGVENGDAARRRPEDFAERKGRASDVDDTGVALRDALRPADEGPPGLTSVVSM